MSVDKTYYQELVKDADNYQIVLKEMEHLKQKINLLTEENHLLRQALQELEGKPKLQR